MHPKLQAHVAFHLTGKRLGPNLEAPGELGLRPALLAHYKNLTALRYDFPLLLVPSAPARDCVQSLSGLMDGLLQAVAPRGPDGERVRQHVLKLEQEIRTRVAEGAKASLFEIWDLAVKSVAARAGQGVADSLARARAALKVDGPLVDCDPDLPARLIRHAWQAVQQARTRAFGTRIEQLLFRLNDIVRADDLRSGAALSPDRLRASFGTGLAADFDFGTLANVLGTAPPRSSLPAVRRQRLAAVVQVLRSQRFFPIQGGTATPYPFVFDACEAALAAYRQQWPAMVELIKAVSIAELEVEGLYLDAHHQAYFDDFGPSLLRPEDLSHFPAYLVCLRAGSDALGDHHGLLDLLALRLPVKVLVLTDDLLGDPSVNEGQGGGAIETHSARLATLALGLNDVYVLQSSSSNLYQYRDRLVKGIEYPGPTLFHVYTGGGGHSAELPPYLVAAAAMQSRAFPAFTYDPSAGPDWASRFSIADNPQPDADWPVDDLTYEDEQHQRVTESVPFTFADFVASDPRYAHHLACVPRPQWNGNLIPVPRRLAQERNGSPETVPYLLMVDRRDALRRVIVHDRLVLAAERCRARWRSLQELGGIRNSHAERAVARERQAWEAAHSPLDTSADLSRTLASPLGAGEKAGGRETTAGAKPGTALQSTATAQPPTSDEPYIETPRCTTCNECRLINDRMFAYDDNQQAYIKDVNAGTYRQLVEAAENCQVSIIHPGKPRDPKEPGLEDLLKRAEAFR